MKAVNQDRYGGPEVLTIREVAIPVPAKGEILIRVRAVPITAAGRFMREGTPYLGRLIIGLLRPKSSTPGVCFSGEVEALGRGVGLFAVGDKVYGESLFGTGTHAQYVCVAENDLIALKPDRLTHAEAAPICDGHLTSMNFLTRVT